MFGCGGPQGHGPGVQHGECPRIGAADLRAVAAERGHVAGIMRGKLGPFLGRDGKPARPLRRQRVRFGGDQRAEPLCDPDQCLDPLRGLIGLRCCHVRSPAI